MHAVFTVLRRLFSPCLVALILVVVATTAAAWADAATLQGSVLSAGVPIAGASLTVYGASASGASALGTGTTNASGAFSISFANPGGTTVLYVAARGGDLGQGANSAISLLALVGTGASFTSPVTVNELTTIATVWSMAQFINSQGSMMGPSPGLQEGAATVPALVDVASGQVSSQLLGLGFLSGNGPAKLISLANILYPCINSSGPSSSACSALFAAGTPPAGMPVGDTLAAAVNLAQHPALNVVAFFAISQQDAAYGSGLSAVPSAWTVTAVYDSHGGGPITVAVDSQGNLWIGNWDGGIFAVTELGPGGVFKRTINPNGCMDVTAVAIDSADHAWVGSGSIMSIVCEIDSSGDVLSPPGGYPTGPSYEEQALRGAAIDSLGNIWFTDAANSLVELNSQGEVLQLPGTLGGVHIPWGIAIDGKDTKWIANNYINFPRSPKFGSVTALGANNRARSPRYGYTKGGVAFPNYVGIDPKGNVWVSDIGYEVAGKFDSGAVTKFSPSGKALSPKKGFQGGGVINPYGLAIDGSGNVWLLNDNSTNLWCHLSEFDSAGKAITPDITGYFIDGYCDAVHGLAIDGAGNIWFPNTGVDTIVAVVGLATPVKTPLIGPVQKP
jgi:sugar lactone lactonase YvrE